jgi:membrane-bound serine protease (ClpP class)
LRVGAKRRIMCGLGLVLVGPVMGVLTANGAQASTGAEKLAPVDVVEVSGIVDAIVAQSIGESIERSQNNGAQAVVLQFNTKGAVVGRDRMAEIATAIQESKIPVAIWVGPSGSRAYGLPAQLLAVADVTAMAPGARMGRTGTMLTVSGKQLTFGAADDAVHTGTLGFLEAREQDVLKFSTDDRGVPVLRNMLFALDGLTIRGTTLDTVADVLDKNGQVIREATTVRFFKLGLMPRLLHTVASPPSAYLLTTIGLALLIFEFFTAGIGIGAFVGAVCLVLGTMGMGALPMSGFGLALLILSMIAFAIDVQVGVPRLWTGLGLIAYIGASFTMFRSVDGLTMRPGWLSLLVCIVGVALTFIVGMPSMVRTRFATPTIGRDNLVGTTGVAVGDVNPEGIVLVDGAQWRARTNRATPLANNAAIRVASIDGITLQVEPLEGAARDYREARKSQ